MGGWIIQMGHLSHQGAPLELAVKDQLWRHLFLDVKVPFQIAPMSKTHWSLLPCHLLDLGSPQCLGISELEEISVTSLYDPSLYRWGHCREGKAHFQCHMVGRGQKSDSNSILPAAHRSLHKPHTPASPALCSLWRWLSAQLL